ncbi:uncharacterized protein B0J16DRAFT_315218 [Fusarium flagelliforme]|uniref:uncharacterized protein n=1 Tax=Fusarium flagelliforme TaxID=2675880 RepID=UPI001E8CC711|nr:uncharacterized protein B0J16DRAFT_315218 [Fusarium flagelliforme]KAH7198929.1 hypothetical protein B0J16DRAFT_315218 [Fusarium flagelliforme]
MVTSTEFFGYEFYNLGPLTSTFTAPASCATVNTEQVHFVNKSAPYLYHTGQVNCDHWTQGGCRPSGVDIDSIISDIRLTTTDPGLSLFYHSPGIACPDSWDTVGVMAKSDGTLSVSGFMTNTIKDFDKYSTYYPTSQSDQPRFMEFTELWNGILKPSDTVVFCGPTSGYDIDAAGRCISTIGSFSDYDYKTWCYVGMAYGGNLTDELIVVSTVSGITHKPGILSWVLEGVSYSSLFTRSQDMAGSWDTNVGRDFAVVTTVEVLPIIFQKSDLDAAAATATITEESVVEKTSAATDDAESTGFTFSKPGLMPVFTVFISILGSAGFFSI